MIIVIPNKNIQLNHLTHISHFSFQWMWKSTIENKLWLGCIKIFDRCVMHFQLSPTKYKLYTHIQTHTKCINIDWKHSKLISKVEIKVVPMGTTLECIFGYKTVFYAINAPNGISIAFNAKIQKGVWQNGIELIFRFRIFVIENSHSHVQFIRWICILSGNVRKDRFRLNRFIAVEQRNPWEDILLFNSRKNVFIFNCRLTLWMHIQCSMNICLHRQIWSTDQHEKRALQIFRYADFETFFGTILCSH